MRISIFGLLRAAAPDLSAVRVVYRLKHWPELPPAWHTADVLRALSVMSNRPVHREWILRTSKLKPPALDELLDMLEAQGDLEVLDISGFRGSAPH